MKTIVNEWKSELCNLLSTCFKQDQTNKCTQNYVLTDKRCNQLYFFLFFKSLDWSAAISSLQPICLAQCEKRNLVQNSAYQCKSSIERKHLVTGHIAWFFFLYKRRTHPLDPWKGEILMSFLFLLKL